MEAEKFSTTFTYDSKGRLSTRTHPSGIVETNNYQNGYLASISAGGATRFTITAMNARQQITAATYGYTAAFGFDAYGYPTSSSYGPVKDYRYSFNAVTGNLNSRQNYLLSKSESFTYDNLDRLKTVTGPQNLSMDYNPNGNITEKSDVGAVFGYTHPTKPYALTGIETSTGLVPEALQTVTYTSYEQPLVITESPYQATFLYNHEGQRAKMEVKQSGNTILTRWYAGSQYIKETEGANTKQYTWIGGDAYTAPCVAIKTNSGAQVYYYLLRDYLGNITHQLDMSNNVVAEYNFDAWGRRRDKDTWSYTLSGEPALPASRGFTSHEWLPWFNLYNMNGRLYDPVVGRFLSADNYVQMPGFTQSFNRYSYCLNNPLKYTDPDGEWLQYVIAGLIILGKNYFDGKKANNQEPNPFKWDWSRAFFMIGNTSSLDGSSSTWHLGIGWSPEALPAIGLNNNDGFGAGYWSPDGVKLGYPGKQTTSPEEKVTQKLDDVRQAHGQTWHESGTSGSLINRIWNSNVVRQRTGDAIFVNTGLSLAFLGGVSDNAGIILPLRGPDAFSPHLINTASFRLGGQLGYDALTIGKAWYNGPVGDAVMATIEGSGNSFDFNIGLLYGFGPGGGGFASYHPNGDISWYGIYGSGGWGVGGSVGFDYTSTRRIKPIKY